MSTTPTDVPVAHTPSEGSDDWHTYDDHVQGVVDFAVSFARPLGLEVEAEIVARLHDAGKLGSRWQARLRSLHPPRKGPREKLGIHHADIGAHLLFHLYPDHPEFAWIGLSHHTGLRKTWVTAKTKLSRLMSEHTPPQTTESRTIRTDEDRQAAEDLESLRKQEAVEAAQKHHADFFSDPPQPSPPQSLQPGLQALRVRMLHSCLIDADQTDTALFRGDLSLPAKEDRTCTLEGLRDQLLQAIEGRGDDTPINTIRQQIFQTAQEKGCTTSPGVHSLSVPTGGGKTLAGMIFALEHAIRHGQQRVIVVLPHISIIEQTAQVYRDIFGDAAVLEHHSSFVPQSEKGEQRRWQETSWNHPIIVTTTVRFFEALFHYRNAELRRLHNIANSFIIFDEAQSLPDRVAYPSWSRMRQLVDHYGVSLLLSTATLPLPPTDVAEPLGDVTEVMGSDDDVDALAERLQRVKYHWDNQMVTRSMVVDQVLEHFQCLVILGIIRNTVRFFQAVQAKDAEGVFYLSSRVTPVDRQRRIMQIRDRLELGLPCRVIATSVVEAGMDLDFPVVFRELAPLPNIIQAAGRCNRHMKNPEGGDVFIFHLQGGAGMRSSRFQDMTNKTQATYLPKLKDGGGFPPHLMRHYYRHIYSDGSGVPGSFNANLDTGKVWDKEARCDLEDASRSYKLIKKAKIPLLIFNTHNSADLRVAQDFERRLRSGQRRDRKGIEREMQPYTVNVFPDEFEALCKRHHIRTFDPPKDSKLPPIHLASPQLYKIDIGLDNVLGCEEP